MTTFQEISAREEQIILQTYKRLPVAIERGEGSHLIGIDGTRYLDCLAGVAVCALGHADAELATIISEQAHKLLHVSNHLYTLPMIELAEKLVSTSGMDKVFYCNSGAEAVETSLKIARKWGKKVRGDSCYKVISFSRGFHGRTFGALSATVNKKYQAPFEPLVPGFIHLEPHDTEGLHREIADGSVCAIIVEPVQGEAGVWPVPPACLKALRALCDEKKILLIVDEVQTGIGRTGKWFGYQWSDILPDIAPLAKALGGGFPIGAVMVRGEAAETLVPGDHGSTFGGNPFACSVALGVLQAIEKRGLLANVVSQSEKLTHFFESLMQQFPILVVGTRGVGFIQALELSTPVAKDIVLAGLSEGLILNATGDTTLRFVPPLIWGDREVRELEEKLVRVLSSIIG